MQAEKMKPQEQVTLEPYERDHAVVVGVYRPQPKNKWGGTILRGKSTKGFLLFFLPNNSLYYLPPLEMCAKIAPEEADTEKVLSAMLIEYNIVIIMYQSAFFGPLYMSVYRVPEIQISVK